MKSFTLRADSRPDRIESLHLAGAIMAAALAASSDAAITWYLQLNGTNLSTEIFRVETGGSLVNGQASAGSYTIQSIVSGSGQSAYVNFANTTGPQLASASANGLGFDWNGTSATAFWRWVQTGPSQQTKYSGFWITATTSNDTFSYRAPWDSTPRTYSNAFMWTFDATSGLVDTRAEVGAPGGTNVSGGMSLVSLTNPAVPVPAPGAIALLGMAGLARRRRRAA